MNVETAVEGKRVAFLDRDGTLIVERGYLADPGGVELVPGVPEALRLLRSAELALVVVTNQSGIARRIYTEEHYRAVEKRLNELLDAAGVTVDATYFCPDHPDFTGPADCRKPATGMHRAAAGDLGLQLRGSYFIGDRRTDLLPAAELEGTGVLVRTGYGKEEEPTVGPPFLVSDDLLAAAKLIVGLERGVLTP